MVGTVGMVGMVGMAILSAWSALSAWSFCRHGRHGHSVGMVGMVGMIWFDPGDKREALTIVVRTGRPRFALPCYSKPNVFSGRSFVHRGHRSHLWLVDMSHFCHSVDCFASSGINSSLAVENIHETQGIVCRGERVPGSADPESAVFIIGCERHVRHLRGLGLHDQNPPKPGQDRCETGTSEGDKRPAAGRLLPVLLRGAWVHVVRAASALLRRRLFRGSALWHGGAPVRLFGGQDEGRRLRPGLRAGRLPRKVLIKRAQWEAIFGDGSYVPDGDEEPTEDDEAPWDTEDEEKA